MLYEEYKDRGFVVVAVAFDAAGEAAVRDYIRPAELQPFMFDFMGWDRAMSARAAAPQYPCLIDRDHVVAELYGMVNVPTAVWIDEEGVLVRPPEVAHPGRVGMGVPADGDLPPDLPPVLRETLAEVSRIRVRPGRYGAALRDWATNGAASRFALPAHEVVERSRPRTPEVSEAAAHFELGQHLFRAGHPDDARPHFRAAHRLDPSNWTYKRQAWSIEDPLQGPSEHYDSDWLADVKRSGAENYYPLPDL